MALTRLSTPGVSTMTSFFFLNVFSFFKFKKWCICNYIYFSILLWSHVPDPQACPCNIFFLRFYIQSTYFSHFLKASSVVSPFFRINMIRISRPPLSIASIKSLELTFHNLPKCGKTDLSHMVYDLWCIMT